MCTQCSRPSPPSRPPARSSGLPRANHPRLRRLPVRTGGARVTRWPWSAAAMRRAHGGVTGWPTRSVGAGESKRAGAPGGRPTSSPEHEVQDTYAVRRTWERTPLPRGSSRGGAAVGPGPHQRPLQKDLAQLGRIHPRPGDNLRRRIGREQPGIPHGLQLSFRLFRALEKTTFHRI